MIPDDDYVSHLLIAATRLVARMHMTGERILNYDQRAAVDIALRWYNDPAFKIKKFT